MFVPNNNPELYKEHVISLKPNGRLNFSQDVVMNNCSTVFGEWILLLYLLLLKKSWTIVALMTMKQNEQIFKNNC